MKVDINCDVGEGVVNEHLIMPYISSCNIACGGHFGDKKSIDKTIELAIDNNIKIGAHPSFPDKENFGRKLMTISDDMLKTSIEDQLNLFLERLSNFNQKLHHIKPHGALYNAIATDEYLATVFIKITQKYLSNALLYVPYTSKVAEIALKNNINIKYEAFADRNYNDDGTLVSRKYKNAVITDKKLVAKHAIFMAKHQKVITITGVSKVIKADTFCLHSDTKNAIEITQFLHQQFIKEGLKIG